MLIGGQRVGHARDRCPNVGLVKQCSSLACVTRYQPTRHLRPPNVGRSELANDMPDGGPRYASTGMRAGASGSPQNLTSASGPAMLTMIGPRWSTDGAGTKRVHAFGAMVTERMCNPNCSTP